MKKSRSLFLMAVLAALVLNSGCGKSDDPGNTASPAFSSVTALERAENSYNEVVANDPQFVRFGLDIKIEVCDIYLREAEQFLTVNSEPTHRRGSSASIRERVVRRDMRRVRGVRRELLAMKDRRIPIHPGAMKQHFECLEIGKDNRGDLGTANSVSVP